MQRILLYLIFVFFLFLIINWVVNGGGYYTTIFEGVENKTKCPEDCKSVKELQKKLSDSVNTVKSLEQKIDAKTQASQSHSKTIAELNESLNEMQKNQSDE